MDEEVNVLILKIIINFNFTGKISLRLKISFTRKSWPRLAAAHSSQNFQKKTEKVNTIINKLKIPHLKNLQTDENSNFMGFCNWFKEDGAEN